MTNCIISQSANHVGIHHTINKGQGGREREYCQGRAVVSEDI